MARGLLIIKTLTPTHPGAGTSLGAIDLMLQREVTTNFPFIQGSSLKGAIRGHLENQPVKDKNGLVGELLNEIESYANSKRIESLKNEIKKYQGDSSALPVFKAREYTRLLIANEDMEDKRKEIEKKYSLLYRILDIVFGPYNPGGNPERSSLLISDASLLFYPVRTLKGLYALVTCPEILRRLNMPHIDLKIPDSLLNLNDKGTVKTLNSTQSKYVINGKVYFEDLNFSIDTVGDGDFNWVKEKLGLDESIKDRLFVVHNDVFQYFVEFATQVMSRNKIDYATGTVDKKIGGIWTEEHLPPETYLFSYLEDNGKVVGKIKVKENNLGKEKDASSFEWVADKLNNNVIHLGGDETVGKGFAELRFKKLQEAKNG